MRRFFLLLVVAGATVAVVWLRWGHRPESVTWRAVDRALAARYPDLASITPEDLARRLQSPQPPLVLDARDSAEVAVSRIPGARHIDPDADALSATLADIDRSREIVVYCSVGVRSAGVVQRLRGAGFEHVENLSGSIFRWANEGRPLVRDGQPVTVVHPYDSAWGRLLDPSRRADL